MGVVDLLDDPLGDQAQAAVEEEYENKAQWLDALRQHETKNANALIHTPVDSHRRDLFASYPPIAGRPSIESIDECEPTTRPPFLFAQPAPRLTRARRCLDFPKRRALSAHHPGHGASDAVRHGTHGDTRSRLVQMPHHRGPESV